ncbi:hypothetical protein PanNE5_19170 [Pandoraea sp. NE5]|nr:hypothetical protein PanNE5_19170 [Pandoraea sp. NE5]
MGRQRGHRRGPDHLTPTGTGRHYENQQDENERHDGIDDNRREVGLHHKLQSQRCHATGMRFGRQRVALSL